MDLLLPFSLWLPVQTWSCSKVNALSSHNTGPLYTVTPTVSSKWITVKTWGKAKELEDLLTCLLGYAVYVFKFWFKSCIHTLYLSKMVLHEPKPFLFHAREMYLKHVPLPTFCKVEPAPLCIWCIHVIRSCVCGLGYEFFCFV